MLRPLSGASNKSLNSTSKAPKLPKIKEPIAPSKIDESISPTRKLINEMTDRIHPFDINKIWNWNSENIRKYKIFIEKFENKDVMMNLMLLDK